MTTKSTILDEFKVYTEFLELHQKRTRLNYHQYNHLLSAYVDNPGIGIKNLLDRFNLYEEFKVFYANKEEQIRIENRAKVNVREHKIAQITAELKPLEERLKMLNDQLDTIIGYKTDALPEYQDAQKILETRQKHLDRFPDNPRLQKEVAGVKLRFQNAEECIVLFDEQIKNVTSEIKTLKNKIKITKNKLLEV